MTSIFPDDPYLTGYYLPFRAEMEADDLVVVGELPDDLDGTFYRNGPDPLYPPAAGDKYHPFDGDGMIYAIDVRDGKASMRNRWVRTRKFELEKAAGRRLFGVFGNPRFSDPSVSFLDYNTANTHIWPHGGKLYALMEGCPAIELDPQSLETLRQNGFEGALQGPFTAHPKTEPKSGALYSFGHQARGPGSPDVSYHIIDREGTVTHKTAFVAPYCSLMHDFELTERLALFPCLPLTIDMQRAMQGKSPTAWDPDKPSMFGLMARDGDGSDMQWVEAPPTFTYHFANASEQDGAVVAEAVMSRAAPLMPDVNGNPPSPEDSRMRLGRWTIRPGANGSSFKEELLDDMDLQFPRIDDRYQGQRYRKVFANGSAAPMKGRTEGFDALVAYDLASGKRDTFEAGDNAHFGEPVFVPRKGSTEEGDGYLLSLVWWPRENRSDLVVMHALDLAAGPIARVQMPTRVPGGFHCHWQDR